MSLIASPLVNLHPLQMPARHVRFSTVNEIYSLPPPLLLSPAASSSASSLGPLTPPPLPHIGFAVPAPQMSKKPSSNPSGMNRTAHNLLALSTSPILRYDVAQHPSTISTHHPGVASSAFLEPAVFPPQATITLVTPHLPWSIPVSALNGSYVTVGDMLLTLHRALQMNSTTAEFNMLRTEKLMRRVSRAYTQRYERLRGQRGYAEEKRGGIKRVDFLMGYTSFQGIAPTADPSVWRLTIS
ncbi:hypothetical protein B0H16DRAFT_1530633 [Mycena metata]|uniref:DUF6699 domain-containing protein n=1 Tax=Mycena metata TaxID=1033252 RepID=A0AAD7JE98_9AGAR|nr:hypothetical protein B0H16DRAFT_1530633 [Mycena metata]